MDTRHFKDFGSLETEFLRADLTKVFKILRGFENNDLGWFFQVVRNEDPPEVTELFKLFKQTAK